MKSSQDYSPDSGKIAIAAGSVAIATTISRILGMVRDTVIAALFSAFQTDCFFMAFTIPNVLRRILGEGSLNAAVIPVYAEYHEKKIPDEKHKFLSALWGAAGIILVLVSVLGVIFAPIIVRIYAWGFSSIPEKFEITTNLTRIMFPYILLVGMTAISTGILNVHGKFFAPALSPAIWNCVVIACIFTLPGLFISKGINTVYIIAVGVMAGGIIQLAFQFFLQRSSRTLIRPTIHFKNEGLKEIGKLMVPLVAGFGIYQLDVLLSRLMASFLPQGSVSYLYYGNRLVDFPQGVIFLALSSASLPVLSKLTARNDMQNLHEAYISTLRLSLFLSIPVSIAMMVMAKPLVSIVFFRGAFNSTMFAPTYLALVAMSPGILGTSIVRVTTPVFFSIKDTKTPVIVAGVNLLIYLTFCFLLMLPFKHIGIAIALSIAPLTQSVLLIVFLKRYFRIRIFKKLIKSILKYIVASMVMAVVMYLISLAGKWEMGGNNLRNIIVAFAAGSAGVVAYLIFSLILGIDELDIIVRRFKTSNRDK